MGKDQKQPKKKKEKIVYIDDGSTVADMSGVKGSVPPSPPRQTLLRKAKAPTHHPHGTCVGDL